jgi:peroxiredoxin family protein
MAQVTQLKTAEKGEQTDRLLIILSKGTMDMVAPAFMIATTGATMGREVHMFFTFWGMNAINKKTVNIEGRTGWQPRNADAQHTGDDSWNDCHGH